MIGCRGIELGQRRQPLLGELRRIPSAHRRDEAAGGHALRSRLDHRLHLGDRGRAFERRVIPGPDAEQDDVIVVVDEAGHDRAAAQVDFARARTQALIAARSDSREPAILDRDFGRGGSRAHPSSRNGRWSACRSRAPEHGSIGACLRLTEGRDGRERGASKHHGGAAPEGKASEVGSHAADCSRGKGRGDTCLGSTLEAPRHRENPDRSSRVPRCLGVS